MQRLILLFGWAVSLGTVAFPGAMVPATACELLSTAEVAAFLRVPAVQIDSLHSGMND